MRGLTAEAVRQALCGIRGHDRLLHFEEQRMSLRCVSCGHETKGWLIGMEEWRAVVGFPDYAVSNAGMVKRVTASKGHRAGILLKPGRDWRGYERVWLVNPIGEKRMMSVHVVVAAAFIGPRPDGNDVNHLDSNPSHNGVGNLEYATRTENMQHAKRAGRLKPPPRMVGAANPAAKLTATDVQSIRERRSSGETLRSLAAMFRVHRNTIWNITKGSGWTA